MTCQVDVTILMIWRFEFTDISMSRRKEIPIIKANGILDKEDHLAINECWPTGGCPVDILPSIHCTYKALISSALLNAWTVCNQLELPESLREMQLRHANCSLTVPFEDNFTFCISYRMRCFTYLHIV